MAPVRPHSFACCLLLPLLLGSFAAACGKEIGDSCGTSLDCSQQASRLCDRTQHDGYCTISPCEKGTCPEEATCVEFRPQQDRLASTFCMRKCSDNSDCRNDEGYRCVSAKQFSTCKEAENLDSTEQRFCANAAAMLPAEPVDPDAATADGGAPPPAPMCMPDAGGMPDAGTPDAGTPDAGTPDAGAPDAGG